MSKASISKLKKIKNFNDLIEYLREELDWPIDVEDAEDITFDYNPKELGIEGKYATKINIIKQIRPLVDNQPWGLFYIEFESKNFPVVVLRRILRALIHNRRSANDRMKTWNLSDLIFISTLGEKIERKISFAHFSESEEGLPVLRTFSWDPSDTYFHYLQTKLDLEKSQRQIQREYGIQIAERNDMASFVEISAKENINVDDAFKVLTEITLEKTGNRSFNGRNRIFALNCVCILIFSTGALE